MLRFTSGSLKRLLFNHIERSTTSIVDFYILHSRRIILQNW